MAYGYAKEIPNRIGTVPDGTILRMWRTARPYAET